MQFVTKRNKVLYIIIGTLFLFSFKYSSTINWTKISKSSEKVFHQENITFEQIEDNVGMFSILAKKESIGFLVYSKARSKNNIFDFYILYSSDKEILKVEVLNYREDHGFEICNKRWLEQFIGLGNQSEFDFKNRVDGISGATISVNSLKDEVFFLTQKIKSRL